MIKFWDSENQKQKAFQYCKRHDLDYNNEDIQRAVRSYYRYKESLFSSDEFFEERHISIEEKQGNIVIKTPKNIFTILDDSFSPDIKEKLVEAFREELEVSQLTPEGLVVPFDPTIKPAPTGFVSNLNDEEWILRYFGKIVYGTLYKTQSIILDFIKNHPFCIIKIFRSAGKSVIVNLKTVRKICENPNLRGFILSEEYSKVVQRIRMIRNLLTAPEIVADYGYLLNDSPSTRVKGKSTEYMFECYRSMESIEPTLMGITWHDKKSLGYHFDFGILDDPWSSTAQNMSGALDQFKRFWGEFQGSLEMCKELLVICTRKGLDDIYNFLENEVGIFDTITIPLVRKWPDTIEFIKDEFGKFTGAKITGDYEITDTCKGKYSMTIEDPVKRIKCIPLLRNSDPYMFEMEYQQRPYLAGGDVFKWENISIYDSTTTDPIEIDFIRMFEKAQKILLMDMAFGESEFADYNAVLLLAKYKLHYFLVDAWIGRWDFNKRLEILHAATQKYPDAQLYIESDFWQSALIKQIRVSLPKTREFKSANLVGENRYRQIYSIYGKKASKLGKIRDGLEYIINNRLLHIAKNLPYFEMIQTQITRFPRLEYMDFLDALAMGVLVFGKQSGDPFDKIATVKHTLDVEWLK